MRRMFRYETTDRDPAGLVWHLYEMVAEGEGDG